MKLFTKFWFSIVSVTIVVVSAALGLQTYLIQIAQNEASSTLLFEQATSIRSLVENNIPVLDIYVNLNRFSFSKKASALLLSPSFPEESAQFFYDDEYEEEVLSYEDYYMPLVESKVMINKYFPSTYDSSSYLILYGIPMPDGTYLLLSCRTVTLQGVILNNLTQFGTMLILALALSTAIAYFLARNISRPLHDIVNASQQIAAGKFEGNINVRGQDELAHVAHSINSMSKELQKASKFKDEIISNVSHSLKTPIAAIRTYCELLQTCELSKEKQREFISVIEDRAAKLEAMVKSMIMLSKIETGTEPVRMAEFDICDLTENCLESFSILTAAKGISLSLLCDLPELCVRTDYEKLSTILSNLVSNAVNYTPNGGRVQILIRSHEQGVDVVVKDTGEGISAEDLPHIWDRFYKAADSRLNRENGTGLGLDIVKRLFDLLQYEHHVSSQVGLGTQVFFTIPK